MVRLDPGGAMSVAGADRQPFRRLEAVRALKERGDVSIGGPGLAASALRAGLVDEYQLFVTPVVVGGGTSFFPDGVRAGPALAEERRFTSGVVFLRYRAQGSPESTRQ